MSRAGLRRGRPPLRARAGQEVLIANTVARVADQIFAMPAAQLSRAGPGWGSPCYTIQIYFDFSGYSDMAIGLGRMFGFVFPENFNYPYISPLHQRFWRRWHISLSTWFRDYLYIPLGGNRVRAGATYLQPADRLFPVRPVARASWTFVVWGLFHGMFLVLERVGLGNALARDAAAASRHAYALAGGHGRLGVLPRATTSRQAAGVPAGHGRADSRAGTRVLTSRCIWDRELALAIVAGLIGCDPARAVAAGAWLTGSRRLRQGPSGRRSCRGLAARGARARWPCLRRCMLLSAARHL